MKFLVGAIITGCFTLLAGAATNLNIAALADLTQPAKQIPFKDVIFATTQHRVISFDTNNAAHRDLFARISVAAGIALTNARAAGLFSTRANEAGNHMEAFVKAALREVQLTAHTPVSQSGEMQATGYPDVAIDGAVPCYVELKTYNAATVDTTQRSFYYSPSTNSKVTKDALHLLLAYELEREEANNRTSFRPVRWKLITLENLQVDLKFEFNQSNRGLYGTGSRKALLGESQKD